MNIFNQVYNEIAPYINFVLIVGIIALGEIVKRLWQSQKVASFYKVLIVTLPLTILYMLLEKADVLQTIVSYLLAYWLYPFIVKAILDKLGARDYKRGEFVGGRPDDR